MVSDSWATVWPAVHDERQALLNDLTSLTAEQWEEPSWCPGWSIHDVVAHLIDSAKTTRLGFVRRMIAAKGDFDRDNATGITWERAATPTLTLTEYQRVIAATNTPPASPPTRLVEAIVHGEDIRGPLAITRAYPCDRVMTALRYQVKTGVSFGGGKQRAAGFRLVPAGCESAAHGEVDLGDGPQVHGTCLAFLLAVSGRPVRADDFTGPGAPAFMQNLPMGK
ncbi:maleylpyruvate isomerase family mycothiol-dependent enzyme [Jonesia quinghaiensis]|uniref:maleylpyruvate isomerase family mycothiol-dependent enzyme n=1 Tax=Jonesia quinghaiensis TaxID=262806 RepID=UPI00042411BC|nr:maleylpyruvate isomerase family mycothiol-dependent enzyme [Jonesia quinghaiensis]